MKKWYVCLVFLFCMLCMSGCSEEETKSGNIYQVYQISSSGTAVVVHDHEMKATETLEILEELITCMSTMPEKLQYKAPFTMGFQLLSMKQDGKVVWLDMSKEYNDLPVMTEVLVRAAIVRTLTQVEEIKYVGITVEGGPLYNSAGEAINLMGAELFIDNDGSEINTYELKRIKLYFANDTGDKMIAAYREKRYSTNISLERFVVEELIKGPSGKIAGLYPTINPQTEIINVLTKDGICYVNLSQEFLTVVNNVSTGISVYSIVNSLVELSNVNKVQILVNGEVPATFSTSVFERNLDDVITLEK
jgi:germination protein M